MSKLKFSFFTIACLSFFAANGQLKEAQPSQNLVEKSWKAQWITNPDGSMYDYGVHHFRKTFELTVKPESFVINVSADQRYQLFVNGQFACLGPARGDLQHWYYETIDIAPLLQAGKNTLAAVVWNYGEYTPGAQISIHLSLIVQGNTSHEEVVNTDKTWKVCANEAFSPDPTNRQDVGPGDVIDGVLYPWGWFNTDYDDSAWGQAKEDRRGQTFGNDTEYTRSLTPRDIPLMEEKQETLSAIRRSEGIAVPENFLNGNSSFTVPANSSATILFDQGHLTAAYPDLLVSKGKGSSIKLSYAEALFKKGTDQKGNRNEIEGKELTGNCDIFKPEGGDNRLYSPLWYRTYRYLEMEITTAGEPLEVKSLSGRFTGYPFEENGSFASDNPLLSDIWNVGWRTARLCATETYFDCPYYEQLQYVGDTRIQALISLYVSGDDRLVRKALNMFDWSRSAEGITRSRYPARYDQFIPPFSLYWINMVHDFYMYRDDPAFISTFLPGIKSVLEWYGKKIDPATGMLGKTRHWNFADWPDEWPWNNDAPTGGVPPGGNSGGSTLLSLQLAYTLNDAVELFTAFGEKAEAEKYRKLAESIRSAVWKQCYHPEKGLLIDDLNNTGYSQHTNIMGILSDAIPAKKQQEVFERITADPSLIQATFYYRFYLHRALKKVGLADRYIDMLQPWEDMLNIGLTTFAERPEPTRSDCHAWSSSPNYDLLATVCGIEPASPGFKTIRVAPHPGSLKTLKGVVPHPDGNIAVDFKNEENLFSGTIILPENTSGYFEYKGKRVSLKSGSNSISVKQ